MKACRDCPPGSKRPAPNPGPRCWSHHRAIIKARRKAAHDRHVQKTYALLPGEYDRLYRAQGGHCWICRRATGKTRRLAVDHDHKTGETRGLLCSPCNRLLGHVRDDPQILDRAAEYLRDPPARTLLGA